MRGELCLQKKKEKEGAFEKKMPTFSLSSSSFFHTRGAPLKNDDGRGGFGGKGEKRRKREKSGSNDETVVVAATTNFERKSRREALVSFASLTSAFVVFFSLLNDADALLRSGVKKVK